MASASVLQRLHQRAKQAEDMIGMLKVQIEAVRQTAAVSVSKPEEVHLRVENDSLKTQVEQLKLQLALAEIRNGVKQVPLPSKKVVSAVSCSSASKAPEVPVVTETAPIQEKGKQKKGQEGTSKPEKTEKAAADGTQPKPKKGKGGGEKKVEPENIDISRLEMRVGKIVDVCKHPDADSLYVEQVDLGEGKPRTIISGLVKHVPIEEMQDRMAVFMCNLKPAKMRGIMSEGMIMCASSPEKVEILLPPPGSQIGDRVSTKEFPGEPDVMLNPKKKVWEGIKPDLQTDADKVAAYKGAKLQVEGKGFVVAPTQANVQIQ